MTVIASLITTLGLNSSAFTSGVKDAKRELRGARKDFRSTGDGMANDANRYLSSIQSNIKAVADGVRGGIVGLVGIGVAGAARQFLSLADEAKNLQSQMALATAKSGNLGMALADVDRIADATRSGLGETSALYGNFMRATEALGGSQAQAARATETFSKALKLGGADANAASSATLQFGQALASGVLRGDEFNSIMEASPRIARLLADSLGVNIGQLRKMAEEGKLTSDVLFRALTDRKFTDGIDAEFKTLPVTFDQAMTLVHNAAITTFGAFDSGGQFSTMLADFIGRGTDGFASLADRAREEGAEIRASFEGLHDVFEPLLAGARSAFGGVRSEANYTRETIASILDGVDQLRNFLPDIQRRAQAFDERTFGFRTGFTGDIGPRSNMAAQFRTSFDRSAAASKGRGQEEFLQRTYGQGFQRYLADPKAYDILGRRTTPAPRPRPAATGGGGSGGRGSGGSRRTSAGPAATEKTVEQRLQPLMDRLFPDEAKLRTFEKNMVDLQSLAKAMSWSPSQLENAQERLLRSYHGQDLDGRDAAIAEPDIGDIGAIGKRLDGLVSEMDPRFKKLKDGNKDLVASYAEMARDVASSLSGLVGNIKSGDWLSAIASVADLVGMIAGFTKGKGGAARTYSVDGARAAGGPVMAGGSYLVGERGPEILRMGGRSGSIVPNHQIGGAAVVQLVVGEGQMFEPRVIGISGNVTMQTIGGANRTAAVRQRQSLAA
nr:hypothetical protein [uncultured organism]